MPPVRRFGTVCEMEAPAPDAAQRCHRSPGFAWTVLQRHGRRPLAVQCRTLLRADNRCAGLPCWSELIIHETAAGRFAVALCHTPPPDAGPAWRDAWLSETPDAVRATCFEHDPLWALPSGALPNGPAAATIEAAAHVRSFRLAWAGLLGAVFGLSRRLGSAG